jgi:uncharacterized protein with PIN domain
MTSDDLPFQQRAVNNPGSTVCPNCQREVELPREEPHLIVGLETQAPQLMSLRCPHCRKRIYLVPTAEDERARDAECDALEDEEDQQ